MGITSEPASGSGLQPAPAFWTTESQTTSSATGFERPRSAAARQLERRYGTFGECERREIPFAVEEVRESGAGEGQFTIRGHAAVFDMWSLDLGGFREKIDARAFDSVLSDDPDVWLLWDHDTRYILSRTRNKTLELRTDPRGLHYWGRVAPTSYSDDLRILMERRDIDQASFGFTVKRDEWRIVEEDGEEERIERTILEVDQLFDVTVTAMGAYPQTDSQVVRDLARDYATRTGRLHGGAAAAEDASPGDDTPAAPPENDGDDAEHRVAPETDPVGEETTPPPPSTEAEMREEVARLEAERHAEFKRSSRAAVAEMKERHLQAKKARQKR